VPLRRKRWMSHRRSSSWPSTVATPFGFASGVQPMGRSAKRTEHRRRRSAVGSIGISIAAKRRGDIGAVGPMLTAIQRAGVCTSSRATPSSAAAARSPTGESVTLSAIGTRLAAAALGIALGIAAVDALAQSDTDPASRRLLLDQAQAARTSGDHRRALDIARRAGEIQMSSLVRLFIAGQSSALGMPAEALVMADACSRGAERDATLVNREAIVARCREVGRVAVGVGRRSSAGM